MKLFLYLGDDEKKKKEIMFLQIAKTDDPLVLTPSLPNNLRKEYHKEYRTHEKATFNSGNSPDCCRGIIANKVIINEFFYMKERDMLLKTMWAIHPVEVHIFTSYFYSEDRRIDKEVIDNFLYIRKWIENHDMDVEVNCFDDRYNLVTLSGLKVDGVEKNISPIVLPEIFINQFLNLLDGTRI